MWATQCANPDVSKQMRYFISRTFFQYFVNFWVFNLKSSILLSHCIVMSRLVLSDTPGLRPIGSWQSSLFLNSMPMYSSQILICITLKLRHTFVWAVQTLVWDSDHVCVHVVWAWSRSLLANPPIDIQFAVCTGSVSRRHPWSILRSGWHKSMG